MGLLSLYNSLPSLPNSNLNPDLLPLNYPATNTGTPTPYTNPGGANHPFEQIYNNVNTYLSNVPLIATDGLNNTLNITNLDVEDPGVNGGPLNDTTTVYPALTTGTPNVNTINGIQFAQHFIQSYLPSKTYLSLNIIKGSGSGKLDDTLNLTNLDKPTLILPHIPTGNPLQSTPPILPTFVSTDPTVYPENSTHTSYIRGFFSKPSVPAQKFIQPFTSDNTYKSFIEQNGVIT